MTAGHFGQKYHESGPGPGTAPAHPPAVISPALRGRRGCSVPLTQHPEPDSSRSQQRTQTTGPCKVQVHDANVTAWPGMAAPRWSDQAPSDRATPTTPHSPASFRQSAGPPHADQGCPTLVFTSLTKAASRSRRRRSRVRDSRRKPVAVPGHHHRPDPTGRPRRPGPGHRGVHPRTRRGPGHRQRDPRRQGGDLRDGLAGQAVVTGRPNCARPDPQAPGGPAGALRYAAAEGQLGHVLRAGRPPRCAALGHGAVRAAGAAHHQQQGGPVRRPVGRAAAWRGRRGSHPTGPGR